MAITLRSARSWRVQTLLLGALLVTPAHAGGDVVLEWNAIAAAMVRAQDPFAQARLMAIVQLAVFEAVNAVTREHEPYLVTLTAPPNTSIEAAAVVAAHRVLVTYVPASSAELDSARARSLATIPDGPAKEHGIRVGESAAATMIAARSRDGADSVARYAPISTAPGEWQRTTACGSGGGQFVDWGKVSPFGIPSAEKFRAGRPPAIDSAAYATDYEEARTAGTVESAVRTSRQADLARFFAVSSGAGVWNSVARQAAAGQRRSLTHTAWALALLNIAVTDSLVASFETKYHYRLWRPETAIRFGHLDGNLKTDADVGFVPYTATPCFPSYPSAHASSAYAALEVLTRVYGSGRQTLALSNPAVPDVTLHYTRFRTIAEDIDDARVYGGVHFRFDQKAGASQGKAVADFVLDNKLRRLGAAR